MNQFEMMSLFVLVSELGSFAAAATEKGIARSVVTRQIAALEEHLGVQLIARSTRRQALTTAGQKYLAQCKSILELVQRGESELRDEQVKPKGNLRISLPINYGLLKLSDILMGYASLYPEITLDLDYSDRTVDVTNEGYDLAIRLATELALSDIVRKLGECQLIFAAAPSYLAKYGMPKSIDDLADHLCLQYTHNSRWAISDGVKSASVVTKGPIKANNGDALAKAAVAGMGIGFMPDFIAKNYLESGQLQQIHSLKAQSTVGIYVVLPSNSYIPERVRLLVDYLSAQLKDIL